MMLNLSLISLWHLQEYLQSSLAKQLATTEPLLLRILHPRLMKKGITLRAAVSSACFEPAAADPAAADTAVEHSAAVERARKSVLAKTDGFILEGERFHSLSRDLVRGRRELWQREQMAAWDRSQEATYLQWRVAARGAARHALDSETLQLGLSSLLGRHFGELSKCSCQQQAQAARDKRSSTFVQRLALLLLERKRSRCRLGSCAAKGQCA